MRSSSERLLSGEGLAFQTLLGGSFLMTPEKQQRLATAVGFLSGVLACMDAVRDATALWPPDAMWEGLSHAHRLEFGGGIALIVVTLVISVLRQSTQPS